MGQTPKSDAGFVDRSHKSAQGRVGAGAKIRKRKAHVALFHKHFVQTVFGFKLIANITEGFAASEDHVPSRLQAKVKQGQDFELKGRLKINEQVAATDEVEFCERRIFCDVVVRKQDGFAKVGIGRVFVVHQRKVTL